MEHSVIKTQKYKTKHLFLNSFSPKWRRESRQKRCQSDCVTSQSSDFVPGGKRRDLGTNLNTDGVTILWPFHCAININFFQWGQKSQHSKSERRYSGSKLGVCLTSWLLSQRLSAQFDGWHNKFTQLAAWRVPEQISQLTLSLWDWHVYKAVEQHPACLWSPAMHSPISTHQQEERLS